MASSQPESVRNSWRWSVTEARFLVFEAALQAGESWPLQKRVRLLQALAEFAGTPEQAQPLIDLAADLAASDRQCREFAFRFSSPPSTKPNVS